MELDIVKEKIVHIIKDIKDYELLDLIYKLLVHSI